MSANSIECPFCGCEEECDHNLIKFVVICEPESYDSEGFSEAIVSWIKGKAHNIDEEMLELAFLVPGKWGSSPMLATEQADFLSAIIELIGKHSSVLNDCLYNILAGITKKDLLISRHAYLVSNDGISTLIDDSLDRLLSTNDNLYLEFQYWTTDWQKIATEANDLLSIFFFLQENTTILSKIVFEQTAQELYIAMAEQKGPALHISRDLGNRWLHSMDRNPPEDSHRKTLRKKLEIKGVSSLWELMSHEYRQYRKGLKVFMNFNISADSMAQDVHKNLFKIGKYLVDIEKKNKTKDDAIIMTEKATSLRRTIEKIETLLCNKYGKHLNGRKMPVILEELNKEGRISAGVKANLSYLFSLSSGLIHTCERAADRTATAFDAGYFYDILRSGFSYIFKNVLPALE